MYSILIYHWGFFSVVGILEYILVFLHRIYTIYIKNGITSVIKVGIFRINK